MIVARGDCRRRVKGIVDSASEQGSELVDGEASVSNDTAHGDRIDRVVPRDHDFAPTIGHDNVPPLPDDLETDLLQGTNGIEMIDTRQLGHD
jgi:hypothetical protein